MTASVFSSSTRSPDVEAEEGTDGSLLHQAEVVRIALGIDVEYAPWAATTIASCLQSNRGDLLRFDILHDSSLSKNDIKRLQMVVENGGSIVEFHALGPSSSLASLPSTEEFGTIVWARLYLPEILRNLPRVLYLDADTFVAGRLADLWQMPLQDAPLAAVANVVEPVMRPHVAALGIDYPGGFFNSGVLLLNLELMRLENSLDRLLRFARDHRAELVWPDQDVLNAVFSHRWLPLHPRFNAQTSLWGWKDWAVEVFGEEAVREATTMPVIRHFEGRGLCKPWHYMCPAPGHKEYREVLASTPWASTPIEDRTPATRLIRLLPGRLQLRAYHGLERWRATRTHAAHRRVTTEQASDC